MVESSTTGIEKRSLARAESWQQGDNIHHQLLRVKFPEIACLHIFLSDCVALANEFNKLQESVRESDFINEWRS